MAYLSTTRFPNPSRFRSRSPRLSIRLRIRVTLGFESLSRPTMSDWRAAPPASRTA